MNRRIKKKYMKRAITAQNRVVKNYTDDFKPLIGIVMRNAWTHHIGREDKDVADIIAAGTFYVNGPIISFALPLMDAYSGVVHGSKKFVVTNDFGQHIVLPSTVRVDIDDGYRNETIRRSPVEGPHFYDEEKTLWNTLCRKSIRLEKR